MTGRAWLPDSDSGTDTDREEGTGRGPDRAPDSGPDPEPDPMAPPGGWTVAPERSGADEVQEPVATPAAWAAVLWPLAVLGHLAANPQHLRVADGVGLLQLLVVAAAGWLLVRPGALPAAALAGLHLVVFWLKLPAVGNHEVILALTEVALLTSLLRPRAGRPAAGASAAASSAAGWADRAAPAARAGLIVSYGFIALSKFNDGFLDAGLSCAALFADEIGGLVGARPGSSGTVVLALAWATAIVEAAIPVLLVVRRTRIAGVIVAIAFHGLLAVDPSSHVWDFSSALLPLFVLFLPVAFHTRLDRVAAAWSARPLLERVATVVLVVATQAVAFAGAPPDWFPAYPLWTALVVGMLALVIGWARDGRWPGGGPAVDPSSDPGPEVRLLGAGGAGRASTIGGAALLVAALATANGLAPYAGIRTAAAFNMYSNLRVLDGESNHLLVPALPGPDRPYARVVDPGDSELRYYRDGGFLVPLENLERWAAADTDRQVVVQVGTGPERVLGAGAGGDVARRGPLQRLVAELEHKLAFRRAVDAAEPRRCLRSWGPIG